jgi:hypothetical protein
MRRCRACGKPIQGEHLCDLADLPKELRVLVEAGSIGSAPVFHDAFAAAMTTAIPGLIARLWAIPEVFA